VIFYLGTNDQLGYSPKIRDRATRAIASRFYFETNHDPQKTIIVCGTARSGTNWYAEILSNLLNYRLIFEPLKLYSKTILNEDVRPYIRPNGASPSLLRFLREKVLTGKLRGMDTDFCNYTLIARGRIVKDVRMSYCLKWIRNNFPSVPILYILRHPCAVAHSWMRLGWGKKDYIETLLSQESLVKEILAPYMDVLRRANTDVARSAFMWCLDQFLAFKDMQFDNWLVTTYEDLYQNPTNEIRRTMAYLYPGTTEVPVIDARAIISDTVRSDSPVLTNRDPLHIWQTELSESQIEEVLEIVRSFSLDAIYDRSPLPHKENLTSILKHEYTPFLRSNQR